jgi:hypothetical protein
MQACNDAVESITAELALQRIAVAEEARKKLEEEAEKRREQQARMLEAIELKARLRALGELGIGHEDAGNNDEGEDSDRDVVVHNPVTILINQLYMTTNNNVFASPVIPASPRPSPAKARRARLARPVRRAM